MKYYQKQETIYINISWIVDASLRYEEDDTTSNNERKLRLTEESLSSTA